MTEIDTKIRHITKAGSNVFADLGFAAEEAETLDRESRTQIQQTALLKEQLMGELASWIEENNLKQQDAATLLRVTRPRVSDVVNKKTSKFTLDALVGMLALAGRRVTIQVG
jgi:predicted XRE-type DNA-binding protein